MSRKADSHEDWIKSEVSRVFVGGRTTYAECSYIAFEWMNGNHEVYVRIAEEKKLMPIALLMASLIVTEHPEFAPNGAKLCTPTFTGFSTLLLAIEFRQCLTGAVMSQEEIRNFINSFHNTSDRPVDNSIKPVDNLVDNSAFACG